MKWLALLLLGAGYAAGCAQAQGLTLSPVMLTAPAEGGAASLTFTSGLAAPKMVQVRVFDWSQADGGEQMTPSAAVKFGPEIFEIAPGKTQTVRFLLPDTDGKGTWRVVVDELPSAADAGSGATQLSLRLRYVLSMFAAPEGEPAALKAAADGDGLALSNPGPGWLKLHGLSLVTADGRTHAADAGVVYLLPGATTRVPLDVDAEMYRTLSFNVGQNAYALDLRPVP